MNGVFLKLCGRDAGVLLDELLSARVTGMREGEVKRALLFDESGRQIDTVSVKNMGRHDVETGANEPCYAVCCHRDEAVRRHIEESGSSKGKPGRKFRMSSLPQVEGMAVGEVSFDSSAGRALVDITKPFFVGQSAIEAAFAPAPLPEWQALGQPGRKTPPKTLLGREHERLDVTHWGPFGSATMPIQYGTGPEAIGREHMATRCAAALYDVSHMLPIIIKGRDARAFLETALVAPVSRLAPGRCQYQGMCLPDGTPLDDLYLCYLEHDFRTGEDVYLLIANSGHEDDLYFLEAMAAGSVMIDSVMPFKRFEGDVAFVSRLRESTRAEKWSAPLYSVSVQGPKSREILTAVVSEDQKQRIEALTFNDLATGVTLVGGCNAVVTYTGYCGEPVGYEVYVEGDRLIGLWRALVSAGAKPAGLGARDSTRQEAGLPLFGHEIGGADVIPFTGGRYPKMVAFEKPFFVGRAGALAAKEIQTHRVVLMAGEGPRKVSAGWNVYDEKGNLVGRATSTSTVRPGRSDMAQAYVEEKCAVAGKRLLVASPNRMLSQGKPSGARPFVVETWNKARDYDCSEG